jgi:ATP-dependent Clp protease ATP-binding subunit ClpX
MPETCNFCHRPRNEVPQWIESPDRLTRICSNCVGVSAKALGEATKAAAPAPAQPGKTPLKTPSQIKARLDELVIGQEDAKREIAVEVYTHYLRREAAGKLSIDGEPVEVDKSNILMMGPSGSGKTHIIRAVAKFLDVPMFLGDATTLTQAGYIGNDVETLLQGLLADAGHDVERAGWGIVVIDEFDKLARKTGVSASGSRDITGEGVQQALLKLVEGTKVSVVRPGQRPVSGMPLGDLVDTTNILFIGLGSFAGIEEVVDRRLHSNRVGFGVGHRERRDKTSVYKQVTVEDVEAFGLIPEIVGRFPILTSTYDLTEQELYRILIEPKNAVVKQFRALYSLQGIDLQFEEEALREIVALAKKRSTGARALRSVVTQVLKPYSYEVPDNREITAIRITADAIQKPGSAVIVRSGVAVG